MFSVPSEENDVEMSSFFRCDGANGQTQFNPSTQRLCSNSPAFRKTCVSSRVFCVRVFRIAVATGNRKSIYTNNNKRRKKYIPT